jgi:hypothetical protein
MDPAFQTRTRGAYADPDAAVQGVWYFLAIGREGCDR